MACNATGINSPILSNDSNDFFASRNSVLIGGSTPHFATIDPQTLNISPANFEEASKQIGAARAVNQVHFSRLTCDIEVISFINRTYNTVAIEEPAHAIAIRYNDG